MRNESDRGFISSIFNGHYTTRHLTNKDGDTAFAIKHTGPQGNPEAYIVFPDGTQAYYDPDGNPLDAIRPTGEHDSQYAEEALKQYTSLD